MTKPDTVTGLRSVLGLFNFSRIYISDFSDLARPLTEALKEGYLCVTPLEWTLEMDESFSLLKSALSSTPGHSREVVLKLLKLYAFKSALTIVSDEIECNHVNIFTDSAYCYHVIHTYSPVWKLRGYSASTPLIASDTPISHQPLIKYISEICGKMTPNCFAVCKLTAISVTDYQRELPRRQSSKRSCRDSCGFLRRLRLCRL